MVGNNVKKNKLKSGLLDRRVIIQSQTATQNANGEEILTWATFATIWADLIPIAGNEKYATMRKTEEVLFRVRIRHLPGLLIDMRLSYENKIYDIKSINELGRRDGAELFISLHKTP